MCQFGYRLSVWDVSGDSLDALFGRRVLLRDDIFSDQYFWFYLFVDYDFP